ncbi:MAG: T9SS type A sorting domain-containing protein [Saprospiraceae bacterium]|nr:T9SS type A sorting domain-containing protein [Saprospiraceae bacterium]
MKTNRTYTLVVLGLLLSIGLKAQEINGPYLVFKLLKDNEISYIPNTYQSNRVIIDSTANGEFILSGSKYDPEVEYIPTPGFIGKDTASYEYKDLYGKFKYLSFIFEVLKSNMVIGKDVYQVEMNSGDMDVTPLSNDSSTLGSSALYIKNISSQNNVSATKLNNSTIRFSPHTDFIGVAYINYTVCDTLGLCKDASIIINVVDLANLSNDTLYRGTPKATPVSVSLPQSGYTSYKNPKNGYLVFDTDFSVLYKPITSFVGKDTFIVQSNGHYRSVFVEVYSMKAQNKIVVNDFIFLPKDSTVVFNIAENDIVKKWPFLLDQSPSRGLLTQIDNAGNFEYQPEVDYEGVQEFTYKVCPQGTSCEYGVVKLFVGNWEPDTRTMYKFATPKNVPLVISYHIPIDAYDFSSPDDSVKFYPGYDTLYLDYKGCKDTVFGYNLLVFHTPKDYAGLRNFTVEYCIPSTNECIVAECQVDVYDESKNCTKHCAGDCVWPGDVNLDGEVTMLDLLEVAYHLGDTGKSRTYQSTPNFRALRSNDWDDVLTNGFANLKHADTDGNGEINVSDTVYISNFYRKQHSLVPRPVYDRGEFPFNLVVLTPNVDSGDLAMIEVHLGEEQYPVINASGYAYELDYNTDVVIESTLGVEFYDQEWAAQNASVLHMYKKPWDGRLESAFGRSNGKKVSGRGRVELISFIVEDDIGGFRKDDDTLKIPFYFNNIIAFDGNQYREIPNQVAHINIAKQKPNVILDPTNLLLYPVPAGDYIKLHLNGKNEIQALQICTIDGRLIQSIDNPNAKQNIITLEGLQNGLYLIKAETTLGPITKKFEILR